MCDPAHHYANIDQAKVNEILDALTKNGATVSGNNPWNVDTHKYGITLQGSWDSSTNVMTIAVTGADWYVPCSKIWSNIDSLMNHISSVNSKELVGV